MPTKKYVQQEQIRVKKSKPETAKFNLKSTVVTLPFDARIASVNVEVSQFLQSSTRIGVADGIATAEVTAQYPLASVRKFFNRLRDEFDPGERQWKNQHEFARAIKLPAVVRFRTGDRDVTWPASVARLNDNLGEQTRTTGIITVVEGPYGDARADKRCPLVKSMFVQVFLISKSLNDKIIIPAASISNGQVYIVDTKSWRKLQAAKIGYCGDGFVIVDDGLEVGDHLVVSELQLATPNTLLKLIEDTTLPTRLQKLAKLGETGQ